MNATHCPRGHDLTSDNASLQFSGRGDAFTMCRQCNRERAKRWREKNRHRLARKTLYAGQTLAVQSAS